ncbi:MAG TPA: transketolase [Candidatus Magasanikbacteria bacterium]|nr:transketolase [Candidatus Magasanikbacteria bacterium]
MLNPQAKLASNIFKDHEMLPIRDGYGKGLLKLGETNDKVVVLCCDLSESTRSQWFQKKYPTRFIEMGIQEQNMSGVAAGLAQEGFIPFTSSYAVFSPGRAWDQIRVSICYNNVHVITAGGHTGVSVGPDGATHQALEDIAIMRVLPNMTVLVPCDAIEAEKATIAAAGLTGPVYIRFAREKTPVVTTLKSPFKVGRAEVFVKGTDVSLITSGPLVHHTLLAAKELLKRKIKAEVINLHTVKPLDTATLVRSVRKTKCVVSIEEHQVMAGVGGAIAEALAKHYPVPQEFVGMQNTFGESGAPEELLKKYHMTTADIVRAALKVYKRAH